MSSAKDPDEPTRTSYQVLHAIWRRHEGTSDRVVHDRLCDMALLDVRATNVARPFLEIIRIGDISLTERLLTKAQEAGGFVAAHMGRLLIHMPPGYFTPDTGARERWVRTWWENAASDEQIDAIRRRSDAIPHTWAHMLFAETLEATEDPTVAAAVTRFLSESLSCDDLSDCVVTWLADRIPSWLATPGLAGHAQTLLASEHVMRKLGERTAAVAIALLDDLETPSTPSRSDSEKSATVARIGRLARYVARRASGDQEKRAFLERLMTASLRPEYMRGILVDVLGSPWPSNISLVFPEQERAEFVRWLSRTIVASETATVSYVHKTWIATDPAGSAKQADVILAGIEEEGALLCAEIAAVAARHWPTSMMPRLMAAIEGWQDDAFCSVLLTIAQNHKNIVPQDLFLRLLGSPDGRYRSLSVLCLDSVLAEDQAVRKVSISST